MISKTPSAKLETAFVSFAERPERAALRIAGTETGGVDDEHVLEPNAQTGQEDMAPIGIGEERAGLIRELIQPSSLLRPHWLGANRMKF
jgi:hypothetical protein